MSHFDDVPGWTSNPALLRPQQHLASRIQRSIEDRTAGEGRESVSPVSARLGGQGNMTTAVPRAGRDRGDTTGEHRIEPSARSSLRTPTSSAGELRERGVRLLDPPRQQSVGDVGDWLLEVLGHDELCLLKEIELIIVVIEMAVEGV